MNNEIWDGDEMLPPELAKDLSNLRQSISTNEMLRAKLRKQLLNDISSAANDRPHSLSQKKKDKKRWLLWTSAITVPVLILLVVSFLIKDPNPVKVTKETSIEVLQQNQIFSINTDSGLNVNPSLSSDMRFLAYEKSHTVWIRGMESGGNQELITAPQGVSYEDPYFSPDGLSVGVSIHTDNQAKIGLISFRTREVSPITSPPPGYADIQPAFSKNGESITFIRSPIGIGQRSRDGELWVMKQDGTKAKKIADRAFEPAWSPDGKYLVFSRESEEGREIWTIKNNGSTEKKLAAGSMPSWSPNGDSITFVSPESEIWLTGSQGDWKQRLTTIESNQEMDIHPIWMSDDQSLYYIRQGEEQNLLDFMLISLQYK